MIDNNINDIKIDIIYEDKYEDEDENKYIEKNKKSKPYIYYNYKNIKDNTKDVYNDININNKYPSAYELFRSIDKKIFSERNKNYYSNKYAENMNRDY